MTTDPALSHDIAFESLAALEAYLRGMGETPSDEGFGLSELDHALQCAEVLKAMAPGDEALQIAGLVHDIGHASRTRPHEVVGAEAVRPWLGDRVAGLVERHVAAKRYLVTTDAAYRARLSPVSVMTLARQGGDLSPEAVAAFEARPGWREALLLRRADEAAKVPDKAVAPLETWLPMLRAVAAASS